MNAAVAKVEGNNDKVVLPKHAIGRTDFAPSLLIRKATRLRSICILGDSFLVCRGKAFFLRQHGTILALD